MVNFYFLIKMGTQGTGSFFYEYWSRAISSDDIFDIDYNATKPDETNGNFIFEKFKDNADEIMKAPGTNGFLQVYYHWSEDARKDQNVLVLYTKSIYTDRPPKPAAGKTTIKMTWSYQ